MTYNEHLLVTASEECTEISEAIDKALRFGMYNYHPKTPSITNEKQILTEYYQLQAMFEMLFNNKILNNLSEDVIEAIKLNKKRAVIDHINKAKSLGTIAD